MDITLLASLTCFREAFNEQGFAWVLESAADLGLDGFEFWNLRGEMKDLVEVRRLMNAMRVTSPSYCAVGTNFASSVKKERGKARDVIRENLEICHAIGAHIMRIDLGHTDAPSYAKAKPMLVEAIGPCAEDARAADVVLAIHNHGQGWAGESLVIKDLVETVGSAYLRARVCPGNFLLVETETDPVASAISILPLAGGILIKDWREVTDTDGADIPAFRVGNRRYTGASIGKGVINYVRFFRALREENYAGPLILKTEEGTEDDLTMIRESIAFIRNALKEGDHE